MRFFTISLIALIAACSFQTQAVSDLGASYNYLDVVTKLSVVSELNIPISGGSGVTIQQKNNKLYILTAKHVVEAALTQKVKVTAHFMTGDLVVSELHFHSFRDAAILVLDVSLKYSTVIPQLELNTESDVVSVGYPMSREFIISDGVLCHKSYTIPDQGLWICTAETFPGGSGGGVFDKGTKRLIGISVAIASHSEGYNRTLLPFVQYFLPLTEIDDFILEVLAD